MNIDYESLATAARIIRSVRAETFEGFLDAATNEDAYVYGRATAACEVAYTTIRELLGLCSGADEDNDRARVALETLTSVHDRPALR